MSVEHELRTRPLSFISHFETFSSSTFIVGRSDFDLVVFDAFLWKFDSGLRSGPRPAAGPAAGPAARPAAAAGLVLVALAGAGGHRPGRGARSGRPRRRPGHQRL